MYGIIPTNNSEKVYSWRQAGMELGWGRTTMLKKLRELGVLDDDNTPTSEYKHLGYFTIEGNYYADSWRTVTRVTPDGLNFLKTILDQNR